MPLGPKKRRAAKNKMATLEVAHQETVDSINGEESKQKNLGNVNSGNDTDHQEDGFLHANDLGSDVSKKQQTLPEMSVRNEKPSKQDTIFISESVPMLSADHEKPDEGSTAEILVSPINNESHQMTTDGSLDGNDLGSDVSKKQETLPEMSVKNEKPSKPDTIFISESVHMLSADHEKPDEGSTAEILVSPSNDESHQMTTDRSDPITGTDLNALPPKRCKTEAKEVLPKTAIFSDELDKTIPLLLTIKARNDNLKVCMEAAIQLSDKLNDAVMELRK